MDFLGRIRKLDSSLQRGLDNSFARVFGGKVVPNELEECLKQEIEDFLMQDAEGRYLAPNDFRIGVSRKDFENLSAGGPDLPAELADRMARYCRNNGWAMSGSVSVRVQQVDSLHTGQLKTASQFTEGFRDESGFFGEDGTEITPAVRPSSLDDGPSTGAEPAQPEAASPQFGGGAAGVREEPGREQPVLEQPGQPGLEPAPPLVPPPGPLVSRAGRRRRSRATAPRRATPVAPTPPRPTATTTSARPVPAMRRPRGAPRDPPRRRPPRGPRKRRRLRCRSRQARRRRASRS